MRLVKLGPNGPWEERYSIDRCQNPDCGVHFAPGRFSIGYLKCECSGAQGEDEEAHRTWRCRACGWTSYDPPHTEPVVRAGGDRYSMGA